MLSNFIFLSFFTNSVLISRVLSPVLIKLKNCLLNFDFKLILKLKILSMSLNAETEPK